MSGERANEVPCAFIRFSLDILMQNIIISPCFLDYSHKNLHSMKMAQFKQNCRASMICNMSNEFRYKMITLVEFENEYRRKNH